MRATHLLQETVQCMKQEMNYRYSVDVVVVELGGCLGTTNIVTLWHYKVARNIAQSYKIQPSFIIIIIILLYSILYRYNILYIGNL